MDSFTFWLPPDVCLNIGVWPSVKFLAHGFVLITESEYFNNLFHNYEYNNDCNIFLNLNDIDPQQFSHILTYLYHGNIQLSLENVFSILNVAQFLKIKKLETICSNFLQSSTKKHANCIVKPIPSRPNAQNEIRTSIVNYKLSWFQPSSNTSFSRYQKPNNENPKSTSESYGRSNVTLTNHMGNDNFAKNLDGFDVACCDGPIKFEKVLNGSFRDIHSSFNKDCEKFVTNVKIKKTESIMNVKIKKKAENVLNIQSYPCKLCGSKFPSYYFMHKHKKICTSTPQ